MTESAIAERTFDYSDIEHADTLRQRVRTIRSKQTNMVLEMHQIGTELLAAKSEVPHGRWEEWRELETGLSASMATRAQRLAREYTRDKLKALKNATLTGLLALAASTTPDQVREDLEAAAEQGQPITRSAVNEAKSVTVTDLTETVREKFVAQYRWETAELRRELDAEDSHLRATLKVLLDEEFIVKDGSLDAYQRDLHNVNYARLILDVLSERPMPYADLVAGIKARIGGPIYLPMFVPGQVRHALAIGKIEKTNNLYHLPGALADGEPEAADDGGESADALSPLTWTPTDDDLKAVRDAIRHTLYEHPDRDYVTQAELAAKTEYAPWQIARTCSRMVDDGYLTSSRVGMWHPVTGKGWTSDPAPDPDRTVGTFDGEAVTAREVEGIARESRESTPRNAALASSRREEPVDVAREFIADALKEKKHLMGRGEIARRANLTQESSDAALDAMVSAGNVVEITRGPNRYYQYPSVVASDARGAFMVQALEISITLEALQQHAPSEHWAALTPDALGSALAAATTARQNAQDVAELMAAAMHTIDGLISQAKASEDAAAS